MTFDFKIDPKNRRVEIQISGLPKAIGKGIRQAFFPIGKDLVAEAKRSIVEGPKTGRTYRIRRRGKTIIHQASAAGEAPANLSGALKNSIDFKVGSSSSMRFEAGSSKVDYAAKLEEGIGIAARPFMTPAIVKNRQNAIQHFEREIEKAAKK